MSKIFFLLALLISNLLGCATCQLMVPTAEIKLSFGMKENRLCTIHAQWSFSDIYTSEITTQFDKNTNQILDASELQAILKIKKEYLLPKNMLTQIKYSHKKNEQPITPTYDNFKLEILNRQMVLSYDMQLSIDLTDQDLLGFLFEDDESFFSFVINEIEIPKIELHYQQNIYLFSATLLFSAAPLTQIEEIKPQTPIQTNETNTTLLETSMAKIKNLFNEIKEDSNPYAYALLLLFAYLYGVIHAMGPGHGKTLVASYFLSNDRSYHKALFISLMIGIVHTFSAFLLTFVIYFLVETFLAQFMDDTFFISTKITALLIIGIALYLFYKKYKVYKTLKNKPAFTFSTSPHVSACGCGSCKLEKNSTDVALIISAGIIPCPGTITLFLFSFSLGLYTVGFLSAFVMSLGMSTIIFVSALLSSMFRKKTSQTNTKLQQTLEYAALVIILLLGIVLLF
ncbi:MAG TPA: hypothetical protein CFH84_09190 [Sulfurimonas sp. UBA12504]|nr:MAG: hypothetical protein A2019_04820 [Sulfurimonas sp. GWF2_37_8]DAB29504.1 MAG TPA: hypothetical protein CFH84_09190 [Sulfurimonas sp. UBA12504]